MIILVFDICVFGPKCIEVQRVTWKNNDNVKLTELNGDCAG